MGKNPQKQKTIHAIKIIFLLGFLAAEFFGFGAVKKAYASCGYNVVFGVSPNSIAANGTVTFNTTVNLTGGSTYNSQGQSTTCLNSNAVTSVIVHYYYETSTGYSDASGDITLPMVNGQAQDTNTTFSISQIPTVQSVTYPVQDYFIARVYSHEYSSLGTTQVESSLPQTTSGLFAVTVNAPVAPPTSQSACGGASCYACAISTGATGAAGSVWACDSNASDSSCGDITGCTNGCQQISSSQCNQPAPASSQAPSSSNSPAPASTAASAPTQLYNPIPNATSLTALLVVIMQGFLGIVAVWAVAFIVIGGFRLVISQGNEEAVTAAKKTIVWAVLGLLVAVLSFAIIAIVQNLVGVNVQPQPTSFIKQNKNET